MIIRPLLQPSPSTQSKAETLRQKNLYHTFSPYFSFASIIKQTFIVFFYHFMLIDEVIQLHIFFFFFPVLSLIDTECIFGHLKF